MTINETKELIEARLKEKEKSIRNKNAIDALLKLFPGGSELWQVLSGAKDCLETEKGRITQEVILEMVLAIDEKLESGQIKPAQQPQFELLLESIRSYGDVTGIRAKTSDPILKKLFSEQDVRIELRDVAAGGNVTGLDLNVDDEAELKRKLEISNETSKVTFNPGPDRKITFGKKGD